MSVVSKAVAAVRTATQAPLIVRVVRQFVTLPANGHAESFDIGYHKFPAGQAHAYIKSGHARAVTDENELTLANAEILRREIEVTG